MSKRTVLNEQFFYLHPAPEDVSTQPSRVYPLICDKFPDITLVISMIYGVMGHFAVFMGFLISVKSTSFGLLRVKGQGILILNG